MTTISRIADVRRAVEALSSELADRAHEMDQVRRLPADLAQKMALTGIFRIVTPKSLGGFEASAKEVVELLEQVAVSNASAGWCAMIAGTSCLKAAYLAPDVAQSIYADPNNISGGVFAPMGRADIEGDSFRVNGRWQWGSGAANCTWLAGGCTIWENGEMRRTANGAPESRMVIFPASKAQLADDWHVSGLRGTGSGSFQVNDLLIPKSRSVSLAEDLPRETGALYKFPSFGLLALGIAAVAMGNAAGAIESVKAIAVARGRQGSRKTLAERGTVQRTFAETTAQFRAARAYLYTEVDRVWDIANALAPGQAIPLDVRADLRLACTHMTRTAAEVARSAYELGGGGSLFENSDLQRRFRDAYAATQHIMTSPDTYEMVGRVFFGAPPDGALI